MSPRLPTNGSKNAIWIGIKWTALDNLIESSLF
jgi:hypothetical protein